VSLSASNFSVTDSPPTRRRDGVHAEVDAEIRALGEILGEFGGRAEHRRAARVLKGMELDVDLVVLGPVADRDEQ
jgi:hypothetical protein